MDLRHFLAWAETEGRLVKIEQPASPHLEMACLIHARQEQPVLFTDPHRPGWQVAAGVCARREHFALGAGYRRRWHRPPPDRGAAPACPARARGRRSMPGDHRPRP